MKYIPKFVFGESEYHFALLPSGIFRRDTFELISRDPKARDIMLRQEKMALNPPVGGIDECREMAKDELNKVISKVNNIYFGKNGN